MTKTENTNTGTRAVLSGVFAAFGATPLIGTSLAVTPGYLPAR